MARYYRRRRTIIRASKKKWCSNMIPVNIDSPARNEGTQDQPLWTLAGGTTIAENKSETTSPSPVVIKTGNFKAQIDLWAYAFTLGADPTIFIIYIPEGVSPNGGLAVRDLMLKHPEWVIAWKKVDLDMTTTDGPSNSNRIILSSRLKRNLNSGDKINIYLFSTSGINTNSRIAMSGFCQFWTCAN